MMNPSASHNPANRMTECGSGWQADLRLSFEKKRGRTVLGKCSRKGPLTFQRPFYPENEVCHLYLLHPPGGLVGGDGLSLKGEIGKNAHTLITTPGATKFYRSLGQTARLDQTLSVAAGGVLEWFPQETILFPGAVADTGTVVDLDEDASFTGWEILCLGRPASEMPFDRGRLSARFMIRRKGMPLYCDCIRAGGDDQPGSGIHCAPGLKGYPVTAGFTATGVTRQMLPELRDLPESSVSGNTSCLKGITLINDLLIARYLGHDPEEARRFFTALWSRIREATLNRRACVPRIWAT